MESSSEDEDCDVTAERQRVLSGGADDDVLRIENLTKVIRLLIFSYCILVTYYVLCCIML